MATKVFEALCGTSFILTLFGACGVDGPHWERALAAFVLGALGTYLFYKAAEWAADWEA